MFYALNWFVVFSLLALWSLGAWAFYSVAAWTVANAGVLAGGSGFTEALRVPDWLAPWLPTEIAQALASMLSAFTPAIEAMLDWAPALAGGLSVAVWVVWALGSAFLIVLGLALSGAIAVLRWRASGETRRNRPIDHGRIGPLMPAAGERSDTPRTGGRVSR